ncbi:hotdog fold thioesterase [Virgibacillus byunsanensis]|uniref:Hotdog fold thioesterase n=1 Tax=Virgibacillus byunsanensis TaxID=570945 RepID=A0ABW3LQ29_9BACI
MEYENTLMEALGMKTISLDKDLVVMQMPVDKRTHQPAGFLHGGATVALAETAASIGAYVNVDSQEVNVFGIEINANHVRNKKDGIVTANARPLHIGRTTMVWDIQIVDEEEKLICVSRCTIGVVSSKR